VHLQSPRSTCGLVWRTSELCLLSRTVVRDDAPRSRSVSVGRLRRFIRAIHRCVRRLVQHVAHARCKNVLLVEVPRGNVPTRVVSQMCALRPHQRRATCVSARTPHASLATTPCSSRWRLHLARLHLWKFLLLVLYLALLPLPASHPSQVVLQTRAGAASFLCLWARRRQEVNPLRGRETCRRREATSGGAFHPSSQRAKRASAQRVGAARHRQSSPETAPGMARLAPRAFLLLALIRGPGPRASRTLQARARLLLPPLLLQCPRHLLQLILQMLMWEPP